MFELQCIAMLYRIIVGFDIYSITSSTVWANEFIAIMR